MSGSGTGAATVAGSERTVLVSEAEATVKSAVLLWELMEPPNDSVRSQAQAVVEPPFAPSGALK